MKSYQLTDGHEPVSHAEIDRLAELARELPPNPVIVNIGAATGVSTCTFLEARPDCTIYSVDVEPCEGEFENARRLGLDTTRVYRLLGDSREIGKTFQHKADMIFVDGGHWNAGEDAVIWIDKVKPDGIMAYHDYQEVCPPNNPGSVFADVNATMPMERQYGPVVDRIVAFKL